MNWLNPFNWLGSSSSDQRSGSLENPSVALSAATVEDFVSGASVSAGQSVNAFKALGYAPLYQAVSMISGDVAKLPLNVYQRTKTGRVVLAGHPVHSVVNRTKMANKEVNAFKFWRRFMGCALIHNNAYAYIDRDQTGRVLGLYNLLPDRTKPVRYKGELFFLTEVGGQMEALRAVEVLHIEGFSIDGMKGQDIIHLFKEDFAIALGRRNFTAKFFKNNMTAGGILQVPPNAKPEAIRKVKAKIDQKFTPDGDSAFKTLTLRDGFKWFATQVDPQKAQLSEMDADQARNIARIYNLNPSRLGVPGSSSYNSDEMARRDYHDGALSHWCIGNVSECNAKLLTAEEKASGIYADYNINALLWADALTRSDIASAGILNGRFSPNETREWENLDGYDGGDAYYRPLNVEPIGATAGQRKAVQRLLEDGFHRACNRVAIKASRAKGYTIDALAEDRETLIEIVEPAINLALEMKSEIGIDARELSEDWIKSWATEAEGLDANALRAAADASSRRIVSKLMNGD